MRGQGTVYVLGFATSVCVVCSLAIAGTALGLRPLQNVNIEIDKKKNVLAAAGLVVAKDKVLETFDAKVRAKVVDLEAGTLSDKSMADLNEKQLAADVYKMTPEEAKYRPVYLVGEGSSEVTIVPIAVQFHFALLSHGCGDMHPCVRGGENVWARDKFFRISHVISVQPNFKLCTTI